MILHIIRHADPDYANNTITEFGWQEAEALGRYLKNTSIDRIYTSPLGRAIDTAKPTLKAKNMDYTVLDWTAESMDYMRKCDDAESFHYEFTFRNGIENLRDLTTEPRNGSVKKLIKGSDEFLSGLGYVREGGMYKVVSPSEETVAVFCHGGFGAAWISHLLLRPTELGWNSIRLNTTSITTFVFENGEEKITPYLKRLGAIPHIEIEGLRINNR